MPLSYVQYQGNGNTTNFAVPFPYISRAHIFVRVNGNVTNYTWLNDQSVQVTPAPISGAVVEVRRETPKNGLLVDFVDGSTLVETDLDLLARQTFFLVQEADDATQGTLSVQNDGSYSASNRRIGNVANPTQPQDVVTRNWAETAVSSQLNQAITQANNASGSAQAAAGSAQAAQTSAGAAANSAQAALASQNAAASSAQTASTSATNASNSAQSAQSALASLANEVTLAQTARTGAETAQTAAESARNAAQSARDTAVSARDTATASATTASNAATSASTSATNASNSASSANSSASAAANSASTADGHRVTAQNAATTASGHAVAADNSRVAAQAAQAAAEAAFDSFDDRYLGPKSSAPSVDNDGNALVGGALYFDTVLGSLRVWTGTAWVASANNNAVLKTGDTMSGALTINADLNVSGGVTFSGTGAAKLNTGTTAQRPASPSAGLIRFNTTNSSFEGHNGSAWGSIGGGATGGGNDAAFYLNSTSISNSYSIPSGQNAGTFGPVSVASGAIVTVPNGSTWTIV